MADWYVAKSLEVLRKQLDEAHPTRPTAADGSIGDARHQATKSDHNPVKPHPGVVTARDFTTDDDLSDGSFTDELFATCRTMLQEHDGRVKYAIYKGLITTPEGGVKAYHGFSQHFDHVHISVSDDPKQYNRTDPWPLRGVLVPTKEEKPDMDHTERQWLAETRQIAKATDARVDKLEDVIAQIAANVQKLVDKK